MPTPQAIRRICREMAAEAAEMQSPANSSAAAAAAAAAAGGLGAGTSTAPSAGGGGVISSNLPRRERMPLIGFEGVAWRHNETRVVSGKHRDEIHDAWRHSFAMQVPDLP